MCVTYVWHISFNNSIIFAFQRMTWNHPLCACRKSIDTMSWAVLLLYGVYNNNFLTNYLALCFWMKQHLSVTFVSCRWLVIWRYIVNIVNRAVSIIVLITVVWRSERNISMFACFFITFETPYWSCCHDAKKCHHCTFVLHISLKKLHKKYYLRSLK